MALAVDSHTTTPVAVSSRAPEPYIDVLAPKNIVPAPGLHTSDQTDSIKLSLSAQIHLLKNQGHSNQQIAIALNVDTDTVASYLGATNATAVPVQTASVAK